MLEREARTTLSSALRSNYYYRTVCDHETEYDAIPKRDVFHLHNYVMYNPTYIYVVYN